MDAKSHLAVATRVIDALQPCSVPVHMPPMSEDVVAAPCVLIGMPEANEHLRVGCGDPYWSFDIPVVVVSETTRGINLLTLTDEVCQLLDQAHLKVTSQTVTYDLPNHPAGLPATRLTVE